jgi:hypothetical protein
MRGLDSRTVMPSIRLEEARMSAHPADAYPSPRPQPTIRSVRAALPPEYRQAFQDDIERADLDRIRKTLADWDVRARAFADPDIMAELRRIADENAGLVPPPAVLSDAEVRALMPSLRP